MTEPHDSSAEDSKIWAVLLGILLLFTAVIFYARHVAIERQEEGSSVPVVARYTNYAYSINLRYPPTWEPRGGFAYDRYEGEDGFFGISAGGGDNVTLEQMVNTEANHTLKPYGSEPYIQKLLIDGQEAQLILPSPDQDPAMLGQAALIVKYPKPIVIANETHYYFIFWADRANIQDIASSITFIR